VGKAITCPTKRDVYDFKGAVNNEREIYLSITTLNIKEKLEKHDYVVLRFIHEAFVFMVVKDVVTIHEVDMLPDAKYWKNYKMREKALETGKFLVVKFLDHAPMSRYMITHYRQRELSKEAKKQLAEDFNIVI